MPPSTSPTPSRPHPQPVCPRAERATMQPLEVVLGSSMRLTFTPSTGELLLVISAKGLTLQLSTTRGALAPDGSPYDKQPARERWVPSSIVTAAIAAAAKGGGGGGGTHAHAGKTRTRVQPGRPSSGGDPVAGASSASPQGGAGGASKATAAAAAQAAGYSAGAVAAAAEAAAPPGPEELQALLARAKALMATSHPEEEASGAAAGSEEPPAAGVGEDMDEGRESPAEEVE
jgi:hypothetical protein